MINEAIAAATEAEGSPDRLLRLSIEVDRVVSLLRTSETARSHVRAELTRLATKQGCDLIVGASSIANEVVRDLVPLNGAPTRALVFDVARISGASFEVAAGELRHLDEVVPAVLLDFSNDPAPLVELVETRQMVCS